MIRLLALSILLLSANFSQAQVLTFDHGKVAFHTSSIMSDIEAVSEKIAVSIDIQTRDVEILIPITSFEFEYEMMQDHFNEEYLESDKYPNASFKGNIIQDISKIQQTTEVDVTGNLTIHGVSKKTQFKATLSKKDGFTRVKCVFPIVFKDYEVDEPSILTKSVAKDVELQGVLYLK
ncbi:MAG: polyisoprenoid-binding protein YceI [Saprospiraceae bacterium]|jgi:polyisoprenoid-binding protein YceI